MKRLAGQLTECEKQGSWRAEQMSQVNRVDRVIGDLSVGQSVSWLDAKDACEDVKKSCFLGLVGHCEEKGRPLPGYVSNYVLRAAARVPPRP